MARIKHRNDAEKLFRAIFGSQAVRTPTDYITSALLEARRALPADQASSRGQSLVAPFRRLPPWLAVDGGQLPHWEARILTELFTNGNPVLMIRGGTGCGKSSTLCFLRDICARAAERKTDWANDFEARSFIKVIDLQTAPRGAKPTIAGDREAQEKQIDMVFKKLADLMLRALRDLVQDGGIVKLFKRVIERPADDLVDALDDAAGTLRDAAISLVNEGYVREDWLDLTPAQVLEVLTSIEGDAERIQCYIVMMAELAAELAEKDGAGFTLVLDNIDPLPEYVQSAVLSSFLALLNTRPLPGFHVAIFVRLATAARQEGALFQAEARLDFMAPDPALIVFYRTTAFLLAPESFLEYRNLGEGDRRACLARLLLLWTSLAEPTGDFWPVLSGLAGTNIRNALGVAVNWCLSERLSGTEPLPKTVKHYQAYLRRTVGETWLGTLFVALGHAAVMVARERPLRALVKEQGVRKASDRLSRAWYSNFSAVLREQGVVSSKAVSLDSFRRSFVEAGIGALENEVEIERCYGFFQASSEALDRLKEVEHDGVGDSLAAQTSASFRRLLKKAAEKDAAEMEKGRSRGALKNLEPYVTEVVRIGMQENGAAHLAAPRTAAFQKLEETVGRRTLERSRFKAVSTLISPTEEFGHSDRCALNIFTVDGEQLGPVPLWVLAMLIESGYGVPARSLVRRLSTLGFEDPEVNAAVQAMVSVTRRVIFSGIADYRDRLETWLEDNEHIVHISGAGVAFLRDVAPSQAYLQWALRVPALAAKSEQARKRPSDRIDILTNIEDVLLGLDVILADERTRQAALEMGATPEPCWRNSPASQLFFLTLPRYQISLAADFRKRRLHSVRDGERSLALASRWLQLADDVCRRHEALGMDCGQWRGAYDDAINRFAGRFGRRFEEVETEQSSSVAPGAAPASERVERGGPEEGSPEVHEDQPIVEAEA